MSTQDLGCLGSEHLRLFGAVTQWFARYELLMQEAIATLSGADPTAVMLLVRRLDFGAQREALLDLLRCRHVPVDRFDRIHAYLLVPHTHRQLLHDIAHARWAPGRLPGSLQPAWVFGLPRSIVALHEVPDDGGEPAPARAAEEDAYSLDDLRDIVRTLATHHAALASYLREIGLVKDPGSQAA